MAEAQEPNPQDARPPPPPPPDMPPALDTVAPAPLEPRAAAVSPVDALDDVLRRARQTLRRAAGLEAAVAAAAGAVAAFLVALFVVGVAPYSGALRVGLLSLVPLGAVVGAVLVGWRRALPLRHPQVVGARLEEALRRRGVSVGDAVRGAVELRASARAEAPDRGRSRALCEAHIAETTRRVVDGGGLESLPAVALERGVPTWMAASVVGFAVVAWVAVGGASFQSRWEKLFTEEGAQRALEERQAQLLPLVTDLKLTVRFPAYMREADQVITGASGDVVAPRGAEIVVEGRADRTVASASVLVNDEERAAEVREGRVVVARFVVERNGTYRFKLQTGSGIEVDPVAHKVTLRLDAAPVVTLEEPAEDRTVKLSDDVKLAFSARDDVGVTRFRVVVKRQGSARQPFVKDLLEVPGGLAEARGTGSFRVDETGARPGEKLSVYVEALDGDDVDGPKAGRSQTRILTVYSPAEQHRALLARLEDVLSRMVDSLGDELEAPLALLPNANPSAAVDAHRRDIGRHEPIGRRHAALLSSVGDALVALAADEIAPVPVRRALANMQLRLASAVSEKADAVAAAAAMVARGSTVAAPQRGRLADAQRALVARLEQDAIYLEDLLNSERIAEARQLAEDLKRAQEDLKALVDEFRESGDPEARKALLDEIQRMRQQMAQLMERLSKLQRDIPDEHLNQEAFETEEMMARATDIDRLIEEGKLDEAAKALEDMLKGTQELLEGLERAGEEFGGDDYKELREKMERFSDELQALTEGQDAMLDNSEAAMDKARRVAEERLKGKLDKGLAEVRRKVQRAAEQLGGLDRESLFLNEAEDVQFAGARTDDLLRALESKDIDDATAAAEEAEAAARAVARSIADRTKGRFGQRDAQTLEQRAATEEAQKQLQAARDELRALLPDPSSLLDKGDKQRLARDADRQEQLRENAERLGALMEQIGKEAPLFGPEHKKRLEDASKAMQDATREMRGGDVRGARRAQRQAARQLSELGRDLQQQGGQQGMGGIPMPLPRGGSPGADGNEEGGSGRRSSQEDVEIPDGSEFQVPDAFRKDILDAMREGAPESWAGEVKRYYEKLIK